MKTKWIKLFFWLLLPITAVTLSDCEKEIVLELVVVDIQAESDWDYLVACKDGDYFFLQEANSKPTSLLLHLGKSDTDIPIFFNEEGLPEKVIINNYILIFENFNSDEVDIALIPPSGEIQYARKIKTDINWDNVLLKSSNSINAVSDLIRWTGRVTGAIPCAVSVAGAFASGGWLIPLAVWECGTYALELVADLQEHEFETQNGFTNFVDKWEPALTMIDCTAGELAEPLLACWASTQSEALSYMADNAELLEQNRDNVEVATFVLREAISVSTSMVTQFSNTTATVGGIVSADLINVSENGVYWGTSASPKTSGHKLQIGSGTGSFSTTLTGLEPNTTYYIEAYATDNLGLMRYGRNQVSFTTTSGSQTAASFTNESHNLNDNQIPQGWLYTEIMKNSQIAEGKLIAYPIDASGTLRRTGAMPSDVTQIKFEWDGNLAYTYWGMLNRLSLNYSENKSLSVYLQTAQVWSTTNNYLFFIYNHNLPSREEKGKWLVPLQHGDFHFIVTVTSASIAFVARNISTQQGYVNQTIPIPSSLAFNLQTINSYDFVSYTTTNNSNWLDNISITLIR